jgi:hypothetical protein
LCCPLPPSPPPSCTPQQLPLPHSAPFPSTRSTSPQGPPFPSAWVLSIVGAVGTLFCLGVPRYRKLLTTPPLRNQERETCHVPRSGNVRSVSGTWVQFRSAVLKHHFSSVPCSCSINPGTWLLSFTYNDKDPMNWLNHCEFFRGQCTLASDWVYLASYHLAG